MKQKLKLVIKNELYGWKLWEIIWLAMATISIIGLSIYWHDTPMGIISSTCGVICVVCTGKGKLSAYIFGLVNSILYAIISYQATYYGETMLNALYYVPMQFVGFYVWAKNINPQTQEVIKRRMKCSQRLLLILSICTATVVYGYVLKYLGDSMPFVDSFTTVSSVFAMIISVKMFAEQWWIWVAVNVFSVYIWAIDFASGSDNIATLLMWIIYLGNSLIMLIKWEKEANKKVVESNEI